MFSNRPMIIADVVGMARTVCFASILLGAWGINVSLAAETAFELGIGIKVSDKSHDDLDQILNLQLLDQDGKIFTLQQVRGETVLLNFIYTGCSAICPFTTADLVAVQHALPQWLEPRIRFVSISVDPEHDSPEALRTYAIERGANLRNWSFVTGDPSNIIRVARFFNVIPQNAPDSDLIAKHNATILVFDAHGRAIQRYPGAPVDRNRLIRELPQIDELFSSPSLPVTDEVSHL